jgi:folate-dependent tRNA-U54 methylase TrmFO/GidA
LKLDVLLEENLLKYKQSNLTVESLIQEQINYFNDRYNKTEYFREPFKKDTYDAIVIALENNLKNHRNEGVIDLDDLPNLDVNNGLEPIDADELDIFSTKG